MYASSTLFKQVISGNGQLFIRGSVLFGAYRIIYQAQDESGNTSNQLLNQ